jgi:AraC-like DNA-binding protein
VSRRDDNRWLRRGWYHQPVRRASTLADFLSAPIGAYYPGRSFIYYYPTSALSGFMLWGRPNSEDVGVICRAIDCEMGPPSREHAALVDTRHLESVDTAAFRQLARYVDAHHEALGRWVRQLAIVVARSVTGATIAGFFGVVPAPYPVRIFHAIDDALRWHDLPEPVSFRELEHLREEMSALPAMVAQLRNLLGERLGAIDLESASRALGRSVRTLQRELRDAGTSFRRELVLTRIREAKRLLAESDLPLVSIAFEVGCPSQQHFASLFRRITGTTPAVWRRQRRRDS